MRDEKQSEKENFNCVDAYAVQHSSAERGHVLPPCHMELGWWGGGGDALFHASPPPLGFGHDEGWERAYLRTIERRAGEFLGR